MSEPRKDCMTSVRFDPGVLGAVKAAAEAQGHSVSEWMRDAVQREISRRDSEPKAPVHGDAMRQPVMSLSIGPGDCWQATLSDAGRANWARCCCNEGHLSPEDAAAHGALLAAQALTAYARSLRPPAIGALILAGKSAA
jgi:hypothetical protein